MGVIAIRQVRNNTTSAARLHNLERPADTDGAKGQFAPWESRRTEIWIPWCSAADQFPNHHIQVFLGGRFRFAIWQASHDWIDRVRISTGGWSRPGGEIGGIPAVGPVEDLIVGGNRILVINDATLWLLPQVFGELLDSTGLEVARYGFKICGEALPRGVPSVPKRSSVAFSMAGVPSDAFDRGEKGARFRYRDSGKRYEFEIRDGVVHVQPPVKGVATLKQAIAFDSKRNGVEFVAPPFDLIAASGGRVFAKERGYDRFYFATMDENFIHENEQRELPVPSTYFKVDPEFNQSTARTEDLTAPISGDFGTHPAGERFPIFRLLLSFHVIEGMIVRLQRGKWHRIDARPPVMNPVVPAIQALARKYGGALGGSLALFLELLSKLAVLDISVPPWKPAPPPTFGHVQYCPQPPHQRTWRSSIAYTRVLDIGVSHVHHHDQYERVTGGELQRLRARPVTSDFFDDYAAVYRFLNGPVADADGFIDGTCNFYALVQLKTDEQAGADRRDAYGLLYLDEQSLFSQRWRLVHPDDYRGLDFAIVAELQKDLLRGSPRRYDWNPLTYWCPFRTGHVGPKSRLAVAAQVLLVTGEDPNSGVPAIFSTNFSWSTMDRTWRWRSLPPAPAHYFSDQAVARGDEPIKPDVAESVYPQTVRLREDMTIHLKGTHRANDGRIEVGRWYQRYLPATNQVMPAAGGLVPGQRPPSGYTHVWKFLPESVFQRADQFSHFGVYDIVDSRKQYYVVEPVSTADAQVLATVAQTPEPWIDDRGQLFINAYTFRMDWLRIPWPPLAPPPLEPKRPPSLVNPETRLRIVPRGSKWIAMHWDKRDDDLLPFAGLSVALELKSGVHRARVTLQRHRAVEAPPTVHSAYFWLDATGTARIAIAATFPVQVPRGPTIPIAFETFWRVRMAAFDPRRPGAVVSLLDVVTEGRFARIPGPTAGPFGIYEHHWIPTASEQAKLRQYGSTAAAMANGTSIWIEDVVGHVTVPEEVWWQPPPAIYGSAIKMTHLMTGKTLHSHALNYGHPGTSGQQQVTAFGGRDDNDWWRVKGPHGQPEDFQHGRRVQHGDIVRLEHVLTRRNLHSHPGIPSPVTRQQEVTAFGTNGIGDSNDNWRLEIENAGMWTSGKRVKFIHINTNHALHSHDGFSHPQWTAGQQEVTGFAGRDDNDWWSLVQPLPL